MGIWVDELRHQYVDSLKTFDKVLAQCPAELWTQRKGSAAVWHEAYHNLFWLKNFVGRADHKFNPHPFGIDMDPRLFAQPSGMVSQDDAKEYLADAVQYVEQVFAELTDEELLAYSKFMRRTLNGFVGLRQKTGKVVEFQHDGRCPECGDPLAVEP
ncbi:hypothetical protein LCGC14_2822740, partial [marine sediment metagenome]